MLWLSNKPLRPGDRCAFCAQAWSNWCVSIPFLTENSNLAFDVTQCVHKDMFVLFVYYRHAQALAALQAYSHWLAQFYSEVHTQNQSQFINLITSAVNASSPLIAAKVYWLRIFFSLFLKYSLSHSITCYHLFMKRIWVYKWIPLMIQS